LFVYTHHFYPFAAEQALCRESDQLRNVSQKYENDKKSWAAVIPILERKIKVKLIECMPYHTNSWNWLSKTNFRLLILRA